MVFDFFQEMRDRMMGGGAEGEKRSGKASQLAGLGYADGAKAVAPKPPAKLPNVKRGSWRAAGDLDVRTKAVVKHEKTEDSAKELGVRSWGRLADLLGVHLDIVSAFNPEIAMSPILEPDAAVSFYVPTASEILFWQDAKKADPKVTASQVRDDLSGVATRVPGAVSAFEVSEAEGRVQVVEAARDRTAGETGDAYAMYSGSFYTRNAGLQTKTKTEKVDGADERVAAWGAAWKCNVFVNDSMDQAGKDTPVGSNKHYATAGSMYQKHTTKKGDKAKKGDLYDEIDYADAKPGDMFVRFGGTGEASSHTEVVTSHESDTTFHATGAHYEGAYERRYLTTQEAYDAAVDELVRQHLRATGQDPAKMSAPDLEAKKLELGDQLAAAAKVNKLDVSAYSFLRHKQVGAAK